MGRKNASEKQRAFIEKGNDRCPICLRTFSDEAPASLEHVPPRSFKGVFADVEPRILCLTCTNCNQGTNRQLEEPARRLGLDIPEGKAFIGGVAHRVTFHVEGDKEEYRVQKLREGVIFPPRAEIVLNFEIPDAKRANLSWLKSAYLTVFSTLGRAGYEWAMDPAVTKIRNQIRGRDSDTSFTSANAEDMEHRNIVAITEDHWVVIVGPRAVFLPGGGVDAELQEGRFEREAMSLGPPRPFGGRLIRRATPTDGSAPPSNCFGTSLSIRTMNAVLQGVVAHRTDSHLVIVFPD